MSSNSPSCSRSLARGAGDETVAVPVFGSTSISASAFRRSCQTMGTEMSLSTNGFSHTQQSTWTFTFVYALRIPDRVRKPLAHARPLLNMQLIVTKGVSVLTGACDRMQALQIVRRLKHMFESARAPGCLYAWIAIFDDSF